MTFNERKPRPDGYNIWLGMKDRCNNPRSAAYKNYGALGIKVCERWAASFQAFMSDMGPRPSGYSLDRIEPTEGYFLENCRWADSKTQGRNKRNRVNVTVDGILYRAIELADISGLKTDTIIDRASKGMSFNQVISAERFVFKDGLALGGKASGAKKLARTHCRNGHELTPENTYWRKDNARQCRECHNAKMRRMNAKKRSVAATAAIV